MKSLSFFKGLSWLIVLNLLVKPVWIFFIDRQVQNIVGHELYGKYFALLNLSYVLYFLSDAGLSSMLNQRMASISFLYNCDTVAYFHLYSSQELYHCSSGFSGRCLVFSSG